MKKINILIPTFNEEENVEPLVEAIFKEVEPLSSRYKFEIVFIDNDSNDKTREKIADLCANNLNIKAIFNAKNFGQAKSPFYGLTQCDGDAVILMCADFQDPIEMIPNFIKEWENGYRIVIGQKWQSKENKIMYWLRSMYYKTMKKISETEQIEHFTGFGLYDSSFISVLRRLDDSNPYLRGIVSELGFKRKSIPYKQNQRRFGKTKNNFYSLYDFGMIGITSYSKIVMRLATFIGFFMSAASLVVAMVYLVLKLIYWDRFPAGIIPVLIGVFLLGSIQLFFIGFLGEYILSMNARILKRPLVIEEQRLNFDNEHKE